MGLRANIFVRTLILLAALIAICCLAAVLLLVSRNRQLWLEHCAEEASFVAEQSERLVLWDDRVALHSLLGGLVGDEGHFVYAFVEGPEGPYVYTFKDGVPSQLTAGRHEVTEPVNISEFRNKEGGVFFDVSARLNADGYCVHLGIERDRIDGTIKGTLRSVAALGGLLFVLCLYPVWLTAGGITHEVDTANRDLQALNDELELRVAERTEELRVTNSDLEEEIARRTRLESRQEEFFAMLRHDMKNTLSIIGGNAELLNLQCGGDFDEAGREMLTAINNNSRSLNKMVENMSLISRLDSDRFSPKFRETVVRDLVVESVIAVSALASERSMTVQRSIPEDLPTVRADEEYLGRALINLLTNAIIYTQPGGSVVVEAGVRPGEGGGDVFISVTDNGPGIDPDECERVFELNYRSPRTSGVKGSGLGLYIVKLVAEAHGGGVEVRSEPGKGSTFSIIIPLN